MAQRSIARDQTDNETRAQDRRFRLATAIRSGDRVLDLGCGQGGSTRDAALEAEPAPVVGIDVDAQRVRQARALSRAERIDNVSYVVGDAQVHAFEPASFDIVISRYGTMFFADPGAAFANIGRALRRRGRLVMIVWQARQRNEWAGAIETALAGPGGPQPRWAQTGDPFSLGDVDEVLAVLDHAGFTEVQLTAVDAPVEYGPTVDSALTFVGDFSVVTRTLCALDDTARAQTWERLRDTLAAHLGANGITFESRSWIVTATRS